MHRAHLISWALAGLLAVLLYAGYGWLQPRLTLQDGLAWDATLYHGVAQQYRAEAESITGPRPFVYRVGAPFLAARLPIEDLRDGFLVVNLTFSVLTFLLLHGLLRALALERWTVVCLLICFGMNPAVIRFIYFYPVHTEPGAICLGLGILLLAIRRPVWGWAETLAATLMGALAIFFREFAILAPLAVLGAEVLLLLRPPRQWKQVALRVVPVVGAALALWGSHQLVTVQDTPYSFSHAVRWSINENWTKFDQFALAVMMTVGPILYLPVVLFRHIRPWPGRSGLMLILYGTGILSLAFVGGWHTDRFVSWGLVAFLPLIGVVVERFVRHGWPSWGVALLLAPVLCAQVLAHRVLAPMPDAQTWDLVVPQDEALIERMLFVPYGPEVTLWHTQAVGLGPEIRPLVRSQYLGLFGYCAVISGALWIVSARRKHS